MGYRRFLALVGTLIAISMLLAAAAVFVGANANKNVCHQVNVVQSEISGVLQRQRVALASNAFFKDHPEELVKAQREITRELRTFAPLHC